MFSRFVWQPVGKALWTSWEYLVTSQMWPRLCQIGALSHSYSWASLRASVQLDWSLSSPRHGKAQNLAVFTQILLHAEMTAKYNTVRASQRTCMTLSQGKSGMIPIRTLSIVELAVVTRRELAYWNAEDGKYCLQTQWLWPKLMEKSFVGREEESLMSKPRDRI